MLTLNYLIIKLNKMKKARNYLLAALLFMSMVPMQLNASSDSNLNSRTNSKPIESTEYKSLLLRVNEIKTLDRSKLNNTEKKQVRKELQDIKNKLQRFSGVYLSVGAIIIIVLILILLF